MPDLHSSHALTHLIVTYGYWAILLGVAVDSFGMPLPGEAMLLTASVYASATHQLLLPLVILCAVAGGVIGDNLSYCLGRQGGTRLLQRFGPLVHLNRRRQLLAQYCTAGVEFPSSWSGGSSPSSTSRRLSWPASMPCPGVGSHCPTGWAVSCGRACSAWPASPSASSPSSWTAPSSPSPCREHV